MIDGIFISFIVGLLCGSISVGWAMLKDFDKTWDEVYKLGFKHGEEIGKIDQVFEHKEKSLFELPKEEKNETN